MTTGDSVTILSIFLLQGLFNGADIMVVQKVAAHNSPDLSSPVINSFRKWRCQDLGPSQLSSTARWRADIPHSESGKFSSFLSQQPPRCQQIIPCQMLTSTTLLREHRGISEWGRVVSRFVPCLEGRDFFDVLHSKKENPQILVSTCSNNWKLFRNI